MWKPDPVDYNPFDVSAKWRKFREAMQARGLRWGIVSLTPPGDRRSFAASVGVPSDDIGQILEEWNQHAPVESIYGTFEQSVQLTRENTLFSSQPSFVPQQSMSFFQSFPGGALRRTKTLKRVPTFKGKPDYKLAVEVPASNLSAQVGMAFKLSWAVNLALFFFKLVASVQSGSKAVLASFVDSAVDLVCQAVIAVTEKLMAEPSPDYPIGRSRLEGLGVIACACIMSIASSFVIENSSTVLYDGWVLHHVHGVHLGTLMLMTLIGCTFLKFFLWLFCRRFSGVSDSMGALAEDHINDVFSNSGALIAAFIAHYSRRRWWWVDPAAADAISFLILYRWGAIVKEQIEKLVGKRAPDEFFTKVNDITSSHFSELQVSEVRAFHFGKRYAVEVDVILPSTMSLVETRDIVFALQQKIEDIEECERANISVDYQRRQVPLHKVERDLAKAAENK